MVIVVRTDMAAVCKYCVVIAVAVSAIFLAADAQWVYMHACMQYHIRITGMTASARLDIAKLLLYTLYDGHS